MLAHITGVCILRTMSSRKSRNTPRLRWTRPTTNASFLMCGLASVRARWTHLHSPALAFSLQHTATLQHTAIHCSALQETTTHCRGELNSPALPRYIFLSYQQVWISVLEFVSYFSCCKHHLLRASTLSFMSFSGKIFLHIQTCIHNIDMYDYSFIFCFSSLCLYVPSVDGYLHK